MPINKRQQREVEATATALLLARKRYDLPAMVLAQGIRARPLRRIGPTSAIESDFAAPFMQIVRAWQAEQAGLISAYQGAAVSGNASGLHAALDIATNRAEQVTAFARRQIAPVIQRIEQWHRVQWVARIKAATGIDIAPFASTGDVAPEIANAIAWNEALAGDLDSQLAGRVSSRAIGGSSSRSPATKADARALGADPATSVESLIADAVAKAKTRALNIAVDQAEKTSAGMTRGRAASAGMGLWRWRHYDAQPHPRPEHIRRDGTVYSSVRPPQTMPGEEPFCKCWQEFLFSAP